MNGVCRATSAMTNALLRHLHGYAALATVLVYTGLVGALGLTLHPRLLLLLPALALVLVVGAVWPWLTLLLVRGHLHFPTDRRTRRGGCVCFVEAPVSCAVACLGIVARDRRP